MLEFELVMGVFKACIEERNKSQAVFLHLFIVSWTENVLKTTRDASRVTSWHSPICLFCPYILGRAAIRSCWSLDFILFTIIFPECWEPEAETSSWRSHTETWSTLFRTNMVTSVSVWSTVGAGRPHSLFGPVWLPFSQLRPTHLHSGHSTLRRLPVCPAWRTRRDVLASKKHFIVTQSRTNRATDSPLPDESEDSSCKFVCHVVCIVYTVE